MTTRFLWGWSRSMLVVSVTSLIALSPADGQAAAAASDGGDRVIVALVPDSVIQNGSVKLVRDNRKSRMNIVYLKRSSASSGLLQYAVQALVIANLERAPERGQVSVSTLSPPGGESSDSATRILFGQLLGATARPVGEAGRVPALVIQLPSEEKLKEKYKGKYKEPS